MAKASRIRHAGMISEAIAPNAIELVFSANASQLPFVKKNGACAVPNKSLFQVRSERGGRMPTVITGKHSDLCWHISCLVS